MKKIILILCISLLSSCSIRMPRITADSPPVANLPIGAPDVLFIDVDKDKDGKISKAEYLEGDVKYNNIDISTPVTVFAWIVVGMLTICGISVSLPRCITCLRTHLAKKSSKKPSPEKRDLLNE